MKQKIIDDATPVTKGILRGELQNYPTKKELRQILDDKLQNYSTKVEMGIAFENLRGAVRGDVEQLLTQFRSEMFSRFDQVVGELAQGREDKLFIDHDIRQLKETDEDQEKRLKKVEKRVSSLQ